MQYNFPSEDGSKMVTLLRTKYETNGNTAIAMVYRNAEGEPCEIIITVNLRDHLTWRYAYIDENNAPGATKFLTDIGAGKQIGIRGYNYCVYPLFQFDEKFLGEMEVLE